MLLNFVAWEQGLRRNLTGDLWKLNPIELAGAWWVYRAGGIRIIDLLLFY